MVRQPRTPCYKLAAKFQRDDMMERFLPSGRSGFYFSVEQEGTVATDDAFQLLKRERSRNHDRRDEPASWRTIDTIRICSARLLIPPLCPNNGANTSQLGCIVSRSRS